MQAGRVLGGVHFHGSQPQRNITPKQLPADVSGFVNRVENLEYLTRIAIDGSGEPTVGVVLVIAGTAGVGKTSLAVRYAHLVRHLFPDGQLYANLRGYDPGPPVAAMEALERFLRALGVLPGAIPNSLEARAELYRTLVAERRLLIILDNAAEVATVRSLLPGAAACLVVITSRSRMSSLVARDGARRLTLDVLDEADAVALLRVTMRDYRADDPEEELRQLARLCAQLPLALRIAAERASSRPFTPLQDLIADLLDESALWNLLSSEDDREAGSVRTVFAWSYRALPPAAARIFRLLGLHPGPDFDTAVAAALAYVEVIQARQALDVLAGAHLLVQLGRDRYQFHDLLRAYAADQVHVEEDLDSQHQALRRLLNWYLYTIESAVSASNYAFRGVALPPIPQDVNPLHFDGHAQAVEWYETERANLVACVVAADKLHFDQLAMLLPAALHGMYNFRHPFDEWIATTQIGLSAARRTGDTSVEGFLLHSLGKAYIQSQQYSQGLDTHLAARQLCQELGDIPGEVDSMTAAALAHIRLRQLTNATALADQARQKARSLQDPEREQFAMHVLGWAHLDLGELDAAEIWLNGCIELCRRIDNVTEEIDAAIELCRLKVQRQQSDDALALVERNLAIAREIDERVLAAQYLIELGRIFLARREPDNALLAFHEAAIHQRQLGNRGREAQAIDGTGLAYQEAERYLDAVDFHRQAVMMLREVGDHWLLALSLANLGRAQIGAGEASAGRLQFEEAIRLLEQFQDPPSRQLRSELVSLLSDSGD